MAESLTLLENGNGVFLVNSVPELSRAQLRAAP
jgi:hypothetical protein